MDVVASGDTVLDAEDNSTGLLTMQELYIDASVPGATMGLKLVGTGSQIIVSEVVRLKSLQASQNYKAKLWISSGTLKIVDSGTGVAVLEIDGGPDATKSAEIDMDAGLEAEQTDFKSGYADVDVANTKVMYGGKVSFETGAYAKKTGTGQFVSGSP